MLEDSWRVASSTRVRAYKAGWRLGLVADVAVPAPNHPARIREAKGGASGPEFYVECKIAGGEHGSETTRAIAAVFLWPTRAERIVVATASGHMEIDVVAVDEADFDERLAAPFNTA